MYMCPYYDPERRKCRLWATYQSDYQLRTYCLSDYRTTACQGTRWFCFFGGRCGRMRSNHSMEYTPLRGCHLPLKGKV